MANGKNKSEAIKEHVPVMIKRIFSIAAALALSLTAAAPAMANQLHPVSGAYFTSETDLKVATRGIPMAWERTYRSNRTIMKIVSPESRSFEYATPVDGPLGYGWYTPFTMRILRNAPIVSDPSLLCDALVDSDGRIIYFPRDAAGAVRPDYANGYTLSATNSGWTLTQRGGNSWSFGLDGRLLSVTDPLGRSATLVYEGDRLSQVKDAVGRTIYTLTWTGSHIARVTDLAGRSIDYAYDQGGNLASVSHDGQTINGYSYNATHGLVSNSNALGESWRINYRFPPSQGIAASLTAPDGGSTVQNFDRGMSTVTVKDPNDNLMTQSRNDEGKLTTEQSGGARSRTIAYLGGGASTITDAQGNVTREYRDQWDNLLKRIDAEGGVTTYSYNDRGKPVSITDPEGSITEIAYDASGALPAAITRGKGAPEQSVTTFTYDQNGDLRESASGGSTTGFTYNDAGLPLTITDPEGNVTTLEYDSVGNLIASSDASGNKTAYGYDWRGSLLFVKDAEGNLTTYAYNAAGRLAQVTDPKGNVTSTTTDHAGRITSIAAPSGSSAFGYDNNGNLITVTRGDATTSYEYDANNRLTKTTDPEGNITTYGYSIGGACSTCGSTASASSTPTSINDPLSGVTLNTLDRLGRVKEVSDPLNNLTRLAYDKVGRIRTRTDAENNTTGYVYDKLGRIKQQQDAEGGSTIFTYDQWGNLLTLTDPENNTTTFEYDRAGRKTKETRPEGQQTTYAYYPSGLLKSVTDAKGQTTGYTYDRANRLTETRFADNTRHTFGYDKNGNLTSYATPDVSATITYDAANRKTSETVTIGSVTKSYTYSYDARGNKQSFTTPEGVTYGYGYNRNEQPTSIATPPGTIALDYNWIRNTKVTLPSGVVTDYAYNANHWLTGIAAQKAPATIHGANYLFDKVGNITQKAGDTATTDYGYDRIYQLLSATNPQNPETFTYDRVGNRKTRQGALTAWTYNKNNELLTADTVTYVYDTNGNTTSKTEAGQTVTFNYNAIDRLTTVQLPDGRTASYSYDPFGRRIKKTITPSPTRGEGGVEGGTTLYLYADEGLIGEYSETGTTRKTYGWRPNGIWGTNPLFMTEGGHYYFYHNDHLGTPQTMTDMNGEIVWGATYEAFGKATVDQESMIVNNLRFPGQYWDEETGLHYNWHRYYPGVGRYISKDLIGFKGGTNQYLYGYARPMVLIDPFGLYVWTNNDLDTIESIMYSWEAANTAYAPRTDKVYRGAGATKGVKADCTGSIYAILNEAGFKVPYFTTGQLDPNSVEFDSNVSNYYKTRGKGAEPQRGDLVLLDSHLVYYMGKKPNGSHIVFGAHRPRGRNFDKHTYRADSFNPKEIYYYDGPEQLFGDKNPQMPQSAVIPTNDCKCSKAVKQPYSVFGNYVR